MISQNNPPTIMIGCPVHNKEWAVNPYLDAIYALDYPKDKISLCFFVNDSVDGTKETLIKRLKEFRALGVYRRIVVEEIDYGYRDIYRAARTDMEKFTTRYSSPEDEIDNFAHFARVRNAWLELRKDEEYYFSIDNDVILKQAFALKQLLSRDKDIIAVPVNNAKNRADGYDPMIETISKFLKHDDPKVRNMIREIQAGKIEGAAITAEEIWNFGVIRGGTLVRFNLEKCLMEVDSTGACILFKASVVEKGVKYGPHFAGEDLYFCSLAKSFGYRIFVDGTLETDHYMDFVAEEEGALSTV